MRNLLVEAHGRWLEGRLLFWEVVGGLSTAALCAKGVPGALLLR